LSSQGHFGSLSEFGVRSVVGSIGVGDGLLSDLEGGVSGSEGCSSLLGGREGLGLIGGVIGDVGSRKGTSTS